ncbi:MAG: LacI family DNA-binding transcriptional regulator [Lachnospiraceae bacterium]|nr:LacI family DNA-binding transcriptional regulator [Lachnospiraceae bacterium]
MVTIKDIAAAAGVSIATVSNVLNGKGSVSKQTEQHIRDLVKELNYTPNLQARSLKNGKNRTIGIIVEDITVFNAPAIIDGIASYCDSHNYHYILSNMRLYMSYGNNVISNDQYRIIVESAASTLLARQVDGIIYMGIHYHPVNLDFLELNVPLVYAYCYDPNLSYPSVVYDDENASYMATKLICEKGHTSIGVIAGLEQSVHAKKRLTGFQACLFDQKIPYNPSLVLFGDWEYESGYQAAERLIKENITALLCQNDIMAIGAIDCLQDHNIEVGKEIAVMGFDNREISSVVRPHLSTIALPLHEIGTECASIMIKLIEGESYQGENLISLPCHIIERDSTERI